MVGLHEIVQAIWQQDFSALTDPNTVWIIYSVMFVTLLLENGLLPAAFLPGDSLLLLAGAMVAKSVLNFLPTMLILATAASLGYWLSYLQGRWLGNTGRVKHWLEQLPIHYRQRADNLLNYHGLYALLLGRFLAFVRTLLPVMAGISGLQNSRFQLFNWFSGALWVAVMLTTGYCINEVPFVKQHENIVMTALMILPVGLMVIGLFGSLLFVWQQRKKKRH